MSVTTNEVGEVAPAQLTRSYRATYTWKKDGKLYRQMANPTGKEWVLDEHTEPNYKIYRALISQTGTNAPTAIVLENTIGDVTWAYAGTGFYTIESPGLFTIDKTFLTHGTETGGLGGTARIGSGKIDASQLYLTSNQTTPDFAVFDSNLTNTSVEIIVYN